MPATPILSEFVIRNLTTPQSFERGQDYFRAGAVHHMERRGNTLLADVEGSSYQPYRVTVELAADGIADVDCTCAYDWGGACKHIVAVLLAYTGEPDQIEDRPDVDSLLAGLDRDTLHNLLKALVARQPHLAEWLEDQLALSRHLPPPDQTPRTSSPRVMPLDANALRRRIHRAKHAFSHEDFYRSGDSILIQTLSELLDTTRHFVEGGDAHGGLEILALLAEETIDDWYEYDHEGEVFARFFEELGKLLVEAMLMAELPQEEREAWADQITEWQGELDEYGMEIEAIDAAIGAAMQGWDDGPLQRVLRGERTQQGAWENAAPWYAATLTNIRLTVLERQGRTTEYLNLARAEGQTPHYLTMLVKLGRVQEAVDYGLEHLHTADDALVVAQKLREQAHAAAALHIAAHGLTLRGSQSALARWLRDFAAVQGKMELALRAAQAAVTDSPTLADYQAVQSFAGEGWPAVRQDLLAQLQAQGNASQHIDIYLYEKMIDEAIKVVNADPYAGYYTVEKVVDAALATHPDWAIRQCRQQAEPIMDGGRSNAYGHALRWLAKARQAYQIAGREQEWQSYLQSLLDKHRRKYSLTPGLKQLL